MARLLEHDALRILSDYGVKVPDFVVITAPEDAALATERFGGKSVIKALIPRSGRGAAGGVRIARTPGEAETIAAGMLGERLLESLVERVLICRVVEAEWEIFVSFQSDQGGKTMLTASALGGIDAALVRDSDPHSFIRRPLDDGVGMSDYLAREVAGDLGLGVHESAALVPALQGMYRAFVGSDASLLEVNPLIVTIGPSAIAATAVFLVN